MIYLRANVNSIMVRTSHDKNRPLLQTADPRRRLEELMAQREPLYREIAQLVIDTGRPNVQSMVQTILDQLDALEASRLAHAPAADLSMNQQSTISLTVDLGDRSYPIVIGPGLLSDPALLARHVQGRQVAIVTNTTVAPLYLEQVAAPLRAAGREVITIILPDGEQYKNQASLMQVFDALLANKCDRKTTLVALGGGVIGDLTGYAAASYMRGVPFVQMPTTLLAQVDSSVGGKTGINHPLGKNMIGAFYQPRAVLADTATLATLPERELSAGLAEVIKYGAIIDIDFFDLDRGEHRQAAGARPGRAGACDRAFVRDQGQRGAPGRARGRPARHPQFRPHLRPRDRNWPGLRQLAARRGGRLRHGDGGRPVVAPGPGRPGHGGARARADGAAGLPTVAPDLGAER